MNDAPSFPATTDEDSAAPSPSEWFGRALVTAITLALGMGMLRALLPLSIFGIRDRFRWSALGAPGSLRLALIVLLLFASAFLAGPVVRRLGRRRVFALGALGCGLATVTAQLWPGDPIGKLLLLGLGFFALLLHLPAAFLLESAGGRGARFAATLCGGLLLDTAIHGAWDTYDPVWRHDLPSLALVIVLVALQLLGLKQPDTTPGEATGLDIGPSWLALAPWLFLDVLIFGNLARLTTLSGWSLDDAFHLLLLGRFLTWLATLAAVRHGLPRRRGALVAAATLLVATAFAWPVGTPAVLLTMGGQLVAGLLLVACLRGAGSSVPDGPRSIWHGTTSLVLFVLLFFYYAAYDLPIPFANTDLLPLAALAMAITGIRGARSPEPLASRGATRSRIGGDGSRMLAVLVTGLLVLSMVLPTTPRSTVGETQRSALRVMTYNIHCGFGPEGLLSLEKQARVIEAENPDVVALQEVARGWAINGSVDTLAWLARRLGMKAYFAPTADPLWGNAVLSRRPVTAIHRLALPAEGRRLRRGLLAVELAIEDGERGGGAPRPLWILATHFHHRHLDSEVRQIQASTLLDFWRRQGRPAAVVLGDLNAVPGAPEISLFTAAGFRDVVSEAGRDPAPTFRSDALERRLDYVLLHGPFAAEELSVPQAPASDHLAVAVTLERVR